MEHKEIPKEEKVYCPNCEIHGVERFAEYIVTSDSFGNIETPLCKECLKKLVDENEDLNNI